MFSMAKKIGKAMAYLQDTVDVFMGWAFQRIKATAKTKNEKHPLKKSLKATLGFFAQIGDSFYKEYEQLKKRKK
jgi:hypothetical protein